MSRKGREFELLIEKLEKIVLPAGAKIFSPGYLKDRITGEQREVDILIEHKVGTSNIKIAIECRDRISNQDTTWIEQIHTKLNDINIDKAIVVSSSQFTQPAIEKAKFYNIETRTYEEINAKLIESWWHVEHINMITKHFKIVLAMFKSDNPEFQEMHNIEIQNEKTVATKFIIRKTDKQSFTMNEVFQRFSDKIDDWENLIPNEPPIRKTIVAHYTNPEERFEIKTNDISISITEIIFEVELCLIMRKVPVSRVLKYGDNENAISHVIEFDNMPIVGNPVLQFIRNSDGSINLSARNK